MTKQNKVIPKEKKVRPKQVNKGKRSNSEKELKIAACVKLKLQWYTTTEIYKYFADTFDLSASQTTRYISWAKKAICAQNEYTIAQEIQIHYKRLVDLYNAAFKKKQYWVSNQVLKSIAELRWLEEAKKLNVNWDLFWDIILREVKTRDDIKKKEK